MHQETQHDLTCSWIFWRLVLASRRFSHYLKSLLFVDHIYSMRSLGIGTMIIWLCPISHMYSVRLFIAFPSVICSRQHVLLVCNFGKLYAIHPAVSSLKSRFYKDEHRNQRKLELNNPLRLRFLPFSRLHGDPPVSKRDGKYILDEPESIQLSWNGFQRHSFCNIKNFQLTSGHPFSNFGDCSYPIFLHAGLLVLQAIFHSFILGIYVLSGIYYENNHLSQDHWSKTLHNYSVNPC